MSEVRLIDANIIYKQIAEKEEPARQRVIDTPSRLPNGAYNPFATQYATQLDERTRFKFMVADAPTVDAEPIRHGHWNLVVEQVGGGYCSCSCCNYHTLSTVVNYCPNCGARMDGTQSI